MKQSIKHHFSQEVLFECDLPEGLGGKSPVRFALELATNSGANLQGADLQGADLRYANLQGAYLQGAYLRYANLQGANLRYANLQGANLQGAYLQGAYLRGAYLRYANLRYANLQGASVGDNAKLIGDRPYLSIGPIGSRSDYLKVFITDKGVLVSTGCFTEKTLEKFKVAVSNEHGSNIHALEYTAAISLIETHAKIWTPTETN